MNNPHDFPKMFTNIKRASKLNPDSDGADENELTNNQKKYNQAVSKVRSRIESIFGEVKAKWKALSMPFAEDCEQLDALIFFAFAVFNFQQYCK